MISGPATASDREFVREQIRTAIQAGGFVLIHVVYQNLDSLKSGAMQRPKDATDASVMRMLTQPSQGSKPSPAPH